MPPLVEAADAAAAVAGAERAFGWDFDRGDVLLDGAGRVRSVEDQAAWRQWVVCALLTQRGAFAVFDRLYGADLDAVNLEGEARRKESLARRTFTAAAMQHPGTRSLQLDVLEETDDLMRVLVTVTSVRGEQVGREIELV